jgi:Bacteriophage HK97-gp10, putative tail-component
MSVQLGPEWEAFNRRLQRTPEQMERDMRRTIQASLLLIEADARQMAPQDTRRLSGSISPRISGSFPNLVGEVGPGVNYGLFVERGRPAGAKMPPVNALIGWVRRHWHPAFIGPIRRGTLRPRRAAGRNVSDREIRSRAFALARSIKRRADEGGREATAQPFMRPAFQRNRARIEAAFARIGLRTVAYLAGQPIP